jgi:hypothetical protein
MNLFHLVFSVGFSTLLGVVPFSIVLISQLCCRILLNPFPNILKSFLKFSECKAIRLPASVTILFCLQHLLQSYFFSVSLFSFPFVHYLFLFSSSGSCFSETFFHCSCKVGKSCSCFDKRVLFLRPQF